MPSRPVQCIGRNAKLKPTNMTQNAHFPNVSSSKRPVIFGNQTCKRAEHREQVDADQHVVDMRDDEIGVGDLQIGRHGGGHHAGDAADDEHHDEAGEVEKGGGQHRAAGPDRREPGEHGDRARNGDREGRAAEESEREERNAGGEHVVQPDAKAERHGRHRANHHRRITDERPAAEEGQSIGDETHRRQHDDVDPRMREHPEQMLPEQRMAAAVRSKEMRSELAVSPQQKERQADRRDREKVADRDGRRSPGEDGNRFSDMPGARMRRKVTTKFAEPTVVEIPRKIIPSA